MDINKEELLDALFMEDYIDDVIEDLQTLYNLTEPEAFGLVKGSAFLVTLNKDPEYVINHDTEYWAERIYTTRVLNLD